MKRLKFLKKLIQSISKWLRPLKPKSKIPPGFPNDAYPLQISTDYILVMPKGKTIEDILKEKGLLSNSSGSFTTTISSDISKKALKKHFEIMRKVIGE